MTTTTNVGDQNGTTTPTGRTDAPILVQFAALSFDHQIKLRATTGLPTTPGHSATAEAFVAYGRAMSDYQRRQDDFSRAHSALSKFIDANGDAIRASLEEAGVLAP